ncbi:MAG: hypothetical protein M3494_03850 [Actinomycetota bacterium]|nr:hypothetical protein [Rubrobacter sp.]MDQ3507138.1 hypothetical protein [Actinomycetota bacterium]
MKKLLTLAATLAMAILAASPALAQGNAAAQYQYEEDPGEASGEGVSATGVVEPLGMTSFMYGTHGLAGSGYVMESGIVNLSDYEGEEVTVYGTLALGEGELEGGPPMISVSSVESSGGQPEEAGRIGDARRCHRSSRRHDFPVRNAHRHKRRRRNIVRPPK